MDRTELIRRLVLSWISDDLENIDQVIYPAILEDGAKLGLQIERTEIVDACTYLVENGLAEAYLPEETPDGICLMKTHGMPPVETVEGVEEFYRTYFGITKKGMELHLSDDKWWPFDAEGNPLAKTLD